MGDGMGQLGQRLLTATEKRRIGKCQKISLLLRLRCAYSFSKSTKTCMEHGTLQTHYPLWFTVRFSVL